MPLPVLVAQIIDELPLCCNSTFVFPGRIQRQRDLQGANLRTDRVIFIRPIYCEINVDNRTIS